MTQSDIKNAFIAAHKRLTIIEDKLGIKAEKADIEIMAKIAETTYEIGHLADPGVPVGE